MQPVASTVTQPVDIQLNFCCAIHLDLPLLKSLSFQHAEAVKPKAKRRSRKEAAEDPDSLTITNLPSWLRPASDVMIASLCAFYGSEEDVLNLEARTESDPAHLQPTNPPTVNQTDDRLGAVHSMRPVVHMALLSMRARDVPG